LLPPAIHRICHPQETQSRLTRLHVLVVSVGAHYATATGAVVMVRRQLAAEWAPRGGKAITPRQGAKTGKPAIRRVGHDNRCSAYVLCVSHQSQLRLKRFSCAVNAPYSDLPGPNSAGLGHVRLGLGQTLSSLLGGQCGSAGAVRQPRVEARSVKIWMARVTTGRASSAR
jgi:hypothetical protein